MVTAQPIDEVPGIVDASLIARGGFAEVFRAEEVALRRDVAVKVLAVRPDDSVLRRFRRESAALGGLSTHPNIVTLHRAGVTESGFPYLVMEYAAEGSLAHALSRGGPLPWRRSFEIGIAICDALSHAHASGIHHLDVKPANILVSDYDVPLLSDFGISKLVDATVTQSQSVTATLAHASPEQVAGGPLDDRADVYSLASTLFQLIDGHPAFLRPDQSGDLIALVGRIAHAKPPPMRGGAPHEASAVIERAMAKRPADRHNDAAEFAAELRDVLARPSTASAEESLPPEASAVEGSEDPVTVPATNDTIDLESGSTPKKRSVLAAIVVGVVVILGLGALALRGGDGPEGTVIAQPAETAEPADQVLPAAATAAPAAAVAPTQTVVATATVAPTPTAAPTSTPEPAAVENTGFIASYVGHRGGPTFSVAGLRNGLIATGGGSTAIVREADAPHALVATLSGHAARIASIAELADDRIVTASHDATARVWGPEIAGATSAVSVYDGHLDTIWDVIELADGQMATASSDRTVRVWDPDTLETSSVYRGHRGVVRALAQLDDGRLVSTDALGEVHLWDQDDPLGTTVIYSSHTAGVGAVSALADGRIASADWAGEVHLWTPGGPDEPELVFRHSDAVAINALVELNDGRLAWATKAGDVTIWDPSTDAAAADEITLRANDGAALQALDQLEDGRLAAAGDGFVAGSGEFVSVWLAQPEADGAIEQVPNAHQANVRIVIELADGRLASAGRDQVVRVWDPDGPEALGLEYVGHTDWIRSMIQLDNGLIASGDQSGTIHIWDLTDLSLQMEYAHGALVWDLTQLSDGRVASASSNRTVHVWSPTDAGPQSVIYSGHTGQAWSVTEVAPNVVASADARGEVHFWNPNTGQATRDPDTRHRAGVWVVASLEDGRILTASADRTSRIWDPDDSVPEVVYEGHRGTVWSAMQLTDGRIATAGDDSTLQIWDPADPDPGEATVIRRRTHRVAELDDATLAIAGWGVALVDLPS